jgi:hypothetical protein
MKRILPLLSLFFAVTSAESDESNPLEPHLQAEEYAVLSVALEQFGRTPRDSVVLVNETLVRDPGMYSDSIHLSYLKGHMLSLLDETIDDLEEKEAVAQLDHSAFPGPLRVKMITNAEIDSLFSRCPDDGWARFDEEYPGYDGFFRTTRVGFNKERDQSLVFITYSCGSLCGQGTYVLLSRRENVWKREKTLIVWIS